MDADFLIRSRCWFGGGTAIVLGLNEYRLSVDVDFLCADAQGYRDLRTAAVEAGVRAFFREPVSAVRDFRVDQYGLRTILMLEEQPIKFEIVREGRVQLDGELSRDLGVPMLVRADLFCEKLLANADRCQDRATAFRDAIDLGMMIKAYDVIPVEAVRKAEAAYGSDIGRKIAWVVTALRREREVSRAAADLRMDDADIGMAVSALRAEAERLWPDQRSNPDAG